MTKDQIIDQLWERSGHGTQREDVVAAFEAGAAHQQSGTLSTTDKLKRLLARCKHSVSIEVNDHRDMYQSAENALDDLACLECPPRITDEVRAQIIATDTIVDIHVYPDTAIGSYHIVHHDIDAALDIALACVGAGDEVYAVPPVLDEAYKQHLLTAQQRIGDFVQEVSGIPADVRDQPACNKTALTVRTEQVCAGGNLRLIAEKAAPRWEAAQKADDDRTAGMLDKLRGAGKPNDER